MPDEIKVGDTVQLKSGGPLMTVDSVSDHHGTLSAICTWLKDGKKMNNRFSITSLKRAPNTP